MHDYCFLGVSIGLFDFLADGLTLKNRSTRQMDLSTYFSPSSCSIVLINPGISVHALSYAGICCVILLLFLPALMAWRGRRLYSHIEESWIVPGGNLVLSFVSLVALFLLSWELTNFKKSLRNRKPK